MSFSALINKGTGWFWTPVYTGGDAAAKELLTIDPRVKEVSIIRNGRWFKTIKREEETT